jgi:glycosyltransferase involved in cell wall biosynthesis
MQRFLAEWLPVRANRFLSLARQQNPQAGTDEVTTVARKLNPSTWPLASQKAITKPFGVNLYGYAKGELGIGEDVRMLALACEAANIPFCVINIELGKDVSQKDASVEGWMSDSPMFGINIFCMTGIEMCRYICERGSKVLAGHYNIGLWPWELPEWPKAWHHAWSLVDELWGVSHYTAKAYAKAPVPVIPMPLPVVANRIAGTDRRHWGLPESAYLFVFSFDMNSRLTRKNPQGVVKAFKEAARDKTEREAGLVLKISHLKRENPQWKQLEAVIGKDPRIHLITSELRRPEVLSLYQNCDCYVSLHRSEGFGRSLAEAQLLGLPLIATGYSGNMEFCKPPTHLVDYTLVSLTKGDYFYGEGQHWAEPDLNQAAGIMRDCLANSDRRPVLYDTEAFSLIYCGKTFKKRLQEISQPEENHGAFCK